MFAQLKRRFYAAVLAAWSNGRGWTTLLKPFSWLFTAVARRRKAYYRKQPRWWPPVPVIVVGNITVGGTGKTPVVASLAKALQARGYRPGIVSRGFGGQRQQQYPLSVTAATDPRQAGDEPVMLAQQLTVPIIVDPDRVHAAKQLYEQHDCNVIIADDGLQHYGLQRHVELLVLDGQRMLGNGHCLPAGPLREPVARLQTVDMVLVNGQPATDPGVDFHCFTLLPQALQPLSSNQSVGSQQAPQGVRVHGVAGIGHPARFFRMLTEMGFAVIPHAFPDHHDFCADDVQFAEALPVLMTAKDAVKCRQFAQSHHWYVPVVAALAPEIIDHIVHQMEHNIPR